MPPTLRSPLLLFVLAGFAFGQNTFTLEKEAGLGAQMAAEIRGRTVQIKDEAIQAYVQRIADRLSAHVKSPFPWTLTVIRDIAERPVNEAVSLPGGYIFIPASLILNAHNEHEFAGVLAHAMAHIAHRDATETASASARTQPGRIPLIWIAGWGNATQAPKFMASLEADADLAANRIMLDAGYTALAQEPDAEFRSIQEELMALIRSALR